MEFGILGPLEVRSGGELVELKGPKLRALLAALVVDAGGVVSVDRLLEVLWSSQLPQTAAATLQSHVAHLRHALDPGRTRSQAGGLIQTKHPGYLLAVDPDQVDAMRFERLASEGHRALGAGAPADAATALRRALDLWRGDALAEFTFDAFAQGEIVRLTELRLQALEGRVEADLALGRHGEVVGELRTLVGEHPLRERLWGYLVLALYRGGRQSDALRACTELRHILREQLGLEPGPEIARAEEQVLRQSPELDWKPPPPPPYTTGRSGAGPGAEVRSRLPLQLTRFVGRVEEIASVVRTLAATRLLTLTGAGGVGKTRLAIEVASQACTDQCDGLLFVELAPLADPVLVAKRVASALQVPEEPGVPIITTLGRHLEASTALLVLDNCEHLLPSVAAFAEALLGACPHLRVLATSREPLRVRGETVWRVGSLSLPSEVPGEPLESILAAESAQLFLDRARAAGGVIDLSREGADALVRICQQLEGIPLALELAAARTSFVTLAEMADLLDDRLGLLTGGSRTAPSRHQTLRATVDWTYESLPPLEKHLFDRLSVFSGGFTLDAATRVCAGDLIPGNAVMDLLSSLVDKSLVSAERERVRTRYRILETLRQYGAEKLTRRHEDEPTRRRHLDWVDAFVAECEPGLWGPDAAASLDRLEEELDNIRDALRRAHRGGLADLTLRLTAGLGKFWRLRGYFVEARTWLEVALAASSDPSSARGKALLGLGSLALHLADYEPARRWLVEALETFEELEDEVGVAEALLLLGGMEQLMGDLTAASHLYERSLSGWRRAGRLRGASVSVDALLHNMGEMAYERGELELAAARFQESIDASRELGVTIPLIHPLTGLGHIASDRGDHAGAEALYQEGLGIARRFGYRRGEAGSLQYLAKLSLARGDLPGAGRLYREALAVWSDISDRLGTTWCLEGLSSVESAGGDLARAAVLLAAADALRTEISTPRTASEQRDLDAAVDATRSGLDPAVLAAASERGRSAPLEAVVAWALGTQDLSSTPPAHRRGPVRAFA